MIFKCVGVAILAFFILTHRLAAEERSDPLALSAAEKLQWDEFKARDSYCHHILAVDADGNALLPRVSRTKDADGTWRYHATNVKLAGEDTRGAKFDAATVAALFNGRPGGTADDEAVRNVLHGRKLLYLYLDEMFQAIARERPDEVVVHIHGGLNNINGAIQKTALISDDLETHRDQGRRIFYIGICWNSDLFPTYLEHLGLIREGLRQPGKAFVTAPAMLLSDLGGAAARLPLNLLNFLYQDAYTVRPSTFKRTQLAQTRIDQLLHRQAERGPDQSLVVSPADNDRSELLRRADAAQWLLTQPGKIATTFFLDWLGSEPWKNMLRRTRTMFERESEFIPAIDFDTARGLAQEISAHGGAPVDADTLLDQMNATGRQGAVSYFCEQAQGRLLGLGKRPVITLIGHSMGTIVSCEVLERFHQLTLDHVVFMGAACSISDFKAKVIPYLEEQNLRSSLGGGASEALKTTLARTLRDRGIAAETIAEVQRQCDRQNARPAAPTKTRFYNLCLHDASENGEKNPGETDIVQRGSLLTWLDVLYQKPESENDRTLGRWVNAILATDSLPGDVVNRVTIKEFGVDRPLSDYIRLQDYAYRRNDAASGQDLQEPMHHGDFGRFEPGKKKEATDLAYWREIYRLSEGLDRTGPPVAATGAARGRHGASKPVQPPVPAVVTPARESTKAHEARTGF